MDTTPNPTQIQEHVYDMDMLNRQLLDSHESTIKALKELTATLKQEWDLLIDEKDNLFDKNLRLKEQRDHLIEERYPLKKERNLLKAERNELKMAKAHFLKEEENNRHKIQHIKAILDQV